MYDMCALLFVETYTHILIYSILVYPWALVCNNHSAICRSYYHDICV